MMMMVTANVSSLSHADTVDKLLAEMAVSSFLSSILAHVPNVEEMQTFLIQKSTLHVVIFTEAYDIMIEHIC